MFGYVRAAAFAAAAVGAAFSPSFADPSLAWGVEAGPVQPTYIDHAAATIEAAPFQPEPLQAETAAAIQTGEEKPVVAQHAVATVSDDTKPAAEAKDKLRSLASLVKDHAASQVSDSEMECLAGAIYFESKGEPLQGQLAVAEVVINRTKSGRYPRTVCGVVTQRGQFSFVRGGRIPAAPRASAHWRKAVAIAHIALNDLADSPASKALSFHATRVSPGWRMRRVATVGNHIFYR